MAIGWSEKSSSGFLCSNWSKAREAPEWAGLLLGRQSEPWGTEQLSSQVDIRDTGMAGPRQRGETWWGRERQDGGGIGDEEGEKRELE